MPTRISCGVWTPRYMRLKAISTITMAARMRSTRGRSFRTTALPKTVVPFMVWPLGKEYPVAVVMEFPYGMMRSSRIQGRYAQAVTFSAPFISRFPLQPIIM